MVDKVMKVVDWFQEKLKSKSGIFVAGILVGVIPFSAVAYVFREDSIYKTTLLDKEIEKTISVSLERDKWQERAFSSENTCLQKMKEMASFFQELETLYKKEEENRKREFKLEQSKLNSYKQITDKLITIDKNLKDEK